MVFFVLYFVMFTVSVHSFFHALKNNQTDWSTIQACICFCNKGSIEGANCSKCVFDVCVCVVLFLCVD